MAYFQVDLFSQTLGYCTNIKLIIPDSASGHIGVSATKKQKYPVLYLLHGLSDDCSVWQRRTSIERYADEYGIAVVMPSACRSWYCDSPYGNFETYIAEELPAFCLRTFGCLSSEPGDAYIAGLSMGGYGALKLAFKHPERFCAAASLSGALLTDDKMPFSDEIKLSLNNAPFCNQNDIKLIVNNIDIESGKIPNIYLCCGNSDPLLESNRKARDFLTDSGLFVTYREADGIHDWKFWDTEIQNALEWMFKSK